jgi:hypothetical protein
MMMGIALLASGFVLAGCNPGLIDDSVPGGIDGDQTGLPNFEVLNKPLEAGSGMTAADVEDLFLDPPSEIGDGVEYWNVFAGLLSFEVKTPKELVDARQWADGYFYAEEDDKWKVITTGNANVKEIDGFKSDGYAIYRFAYEESGDNDSGSYREIGIDYIYVNADVTFRRDEIKEEWNATGDSGTKTYKAFKLELKKGWNLVQMDYTHTWNDNIEDETTSVTIATKDVPWTVDATNNDTKNKGFRGTLR